MTIVVVVVVVISASCVGYGVRSFFAKLFLSKIFFGKVIVFRHLNMDSLKSFLGYTFSQFQDKKKFSKILSRNH